MVGQRRKSVPPTPGSSIGTTGVWGQVTNPFESIEEGELYSAILDRDLSDP